MRIATWNINSVRLRIGLLKKLVDEQSPDIICLQETKVVDELFPLEQIQAMGYEHVIFRGEKSYNGVAIISKIPINDHSKINIANSQDSRHISAILPNDVELHNFYIPAGGDEPDVDINPKYKFKLDFVDYMAGWFTKHRNNKDKMIILGDFNIAPLEHDVWSHKQLLQVVSHTEPEITRLNKLQKSLDWVDTGRHFVPEDQKLYSWWSYRNKDWKKSNRGRRLDHIWTTKPLESHLQNHQVIISARDWEKPSDHAPVIVDVRL